MLPPEIYESLRLGPDLGYFVLFRLWALENHNKSYKNRKNINSVAMDSLFVDIQDGYDGDVWNDFFTPGIVHACLNHLNAKSIPNEF